MRGRARSNALGSSAPLRSLSAAEKLCESRAEFTPPPPPQDFLFLQPLVRCAQPAPAKAAFFAALPKLKIAVKAIADGAELSPAAAAAVVDTVVEALDQAAAAGGGVA